MHKPNNHVDYTLLSIAGLIIFFGLFILASAVSVGSQFRIVQQILMGLLPGGLVAYALYKIPLPVLERWAPYLLLANLVLVAMIFIPFFSETIRGGSRWLSVFGLFSFQPTEFLKLTFILYISGWLITKTKKKKISLFKNMFLPFIALCGLIGFLLLKQPDFSTLVIILSTAYIIYFSAKTPLWHSLSLLSLGSLGLFIFIKISEYRLERVLGFWDPNFDPLGATYQIKQALITVGSGGLFGLGLGMSQQKFGFLPFPESDSIFAILAEETGFIGSAILILLFLGFFWRGFLIAKNSNYDFAKLVSLGICSWIFIQTSVNIGVMIGIFPVTGIPLPFISYGKSHLIAEMMGLGILLNASRYKKK